MTPIERLLQYLDYIGNRPSHFESRVGMSSGYINSQKRGKGTIGSTILEKIHKNCPDLNTDWLITGNGSMLSESAVANMNEPTADYAISPQKHNGRSAIGANTGIPVYLSSIPLSAEQKKTGIKPQRPDMVLQLPEYADCVACKIYDDTLEGEAGIPKGSYLFLVEITNWRTFLEFNKMYEVRLKDNRRLYYRLYTVTPDSLRLVAVSPSYAPLEINMDFIDSVWKIKGYMPPPLP